MALRQRCTSFTHLVGAIALAIVSHAGAGWAQPALPAPTTAFAGGSPQLVKLTSAGDRLYFADYLNQRIGFADVDASGAIGAFTPVPFTNPGGQPARPGGLAVCPSGRVVVVEHPTGTVTLFDANLSVIGSAPSPRATTGAGPLNAIVCIARGAAEWAYVNQDAYWTYVVQPDPDDYESVPFTATLPNEVVRYAVTSTGIALGPSTQLPDSGSGPFANLASPTRFIAAPRLVASPDGTRLFATNARSGSVSSLTVAVDGSLAFVSNARFQSSARTTGGLAIDGAGQVLQVALGEYSSTPGASVNSGIQSFAIDSLGRLSAIGVGMAGASNSPVDAIQLHPNGQDLVLAAPEGSGNVHVVDRYTLADVYQPLPGLIPTSFAFAASGARMYVGTAVGRIALVRFGTYSLTVTTNGAGTVTPGTGDHPARSLVSLTASPAPGNAFVGWSGACGGTAPTCTVLMDGDEAVIANFAPAQYTFSVEMRDSAGGNSTPGAIVLADVDGVYFLSCVNGGTCSAPLPAGKLVTLTATPATGTVVTWTGCTPLANPNQCTVTTASANTTVGVAFGPTPSSSLTPITIQVNGSGVVEGCVGPATCPHTPLLPGTVVTLSVKPAPGWVTKAVKNCVLVNARTGCRFTVPSSPITVGVGFRELPPPEE